MQITDKASRLGHLQLTGFNYIAMIYLLGVRNILRNICMQFLLSHHLWSCWSCLYPTASYSPDIRTFQFIY